MSKSTVLRALKRLESLRIIQVKRKKDPRTKRQMVNVYVLLEDAEWIKEPGVISEPGAGCQKMIDPGVKNDQKPGVTRVLEGSTEEKDTHRRIGAIAPDPPEPEKKCKEEGCNKDPLKDRDLCKEHQPLTCKEFIEWFRKSDRRYLNIIAEFADEVKPEFETLFQWETWANAHYRAAKLLVAFSDQQIAKGYERLKAAGYISEFNLHTVHKFIINTPKK